MPGFSKELCSRFSFYLCFQYFSMIIRLSSQNFEKTFMPGYCEEQRSSYCFLYPLIDNYIMDKSGMIFRTDNINIKRKLRTFSI